MPSPRKRRSWFGTPGFNPDVLPPWGEQRLPLMTAKAIAAMIHGARLGRCELVPGEAGGWRVLVFPAGGGEPLLLCGLGDAAPLLAAAHHAFGEGRGWRKTRPPAPPSSQAERQIREALTDVFAAKAETAALLDDVEAQCRALGLPATGLDTLRDALEGDEEATP